MDYTTTVEITNAFVVPKLNVSNRIGLEKGPNHFNYLADLKFPTREEGDVTVLIGMDVQEAHIYIDYRQPPTGDTGPNALLTSFGWCMVGKLQNNQKDCRSINRREVNHIEVRNYDLCDLVHNFWRTESFGVTPSADKLVSSEDRKAIETLNNTIKFIGDRYEVGLPWKKSDVVLPKNRTAAIRRLQAV